MIKDDISYLETTLNSAHSMAGQHQAQSLHCSISPHPTSDNTITLLSLYRWENRGREMVTQSVVAVSRSQEGSETLGF